MWRVDLSDVTASKVLDGEKEIENTTAWSTPRRNSASFVQFPVANIRTKVPCTDVNKPPIDDHSQENLQTRLQSPANAHQDSGP